MSEGQQRSSTRNLSRRIAPQIPQNATASVKALAEPSCPKLRVVDPLDYEGELNSRRRDLEREQFLNLLLFPQQDISVNGDEDDTAELLRELQKIRKERKEEQEKQERERKKEEERIRTENLLRGNPLLNQQQNSSFKIKRMWDDDVVFKNCAKGEQRNKEKHFINDTIHSEFHRKFMDKYIR